jgi:hypothetical protein
MKIGKFWIVIFAACGSAVFASLLRSKLRNEKQVHKGQLHEWENEGGNLAPSPTPSSTVLTPEQPNGTSA